MQQLHLVGFTTDLEGLIFSARRGSQSGGYMVVLDERLVARIEEALQLREARMADSDAPADQGDRRVFPEEEPLDGGEGGERGDEGAGEQPEDDEAAAYAPPPAIRRGARLREVRDERNRSESALTPREMQARLRAGYSIADVAAEAGVGEDWVARFAAPILAEQQQVLDRARELVFTAPRKGESTLPLGESVQWAVAERGVAMGGADFEQAWSAYQLRDGTWVVRFSYTSRKREQHADWQVNLRAGVLTALNRLATDLGYVGKGQGPRRAAPEPVVEAAPAPVRRRKSSPGRRQAMPPRPPRVALAEEVAATKAPGRPAPAKQAAAQRAVAKQAAVKKAPAKKAVVRKAAAKQTVAKKTVTRKAPAPAVGRVAAAGKVTGRRALAAAVKATSPGEDAGVDWNRPPVVRRRPRAQAKAAEAAAGGGEHRPVAKKARSTRATSKKREPDGSTPPEAVVAPPPAPPTASAPAPLAAAQPDPAASPPEPTRATPPEPEPEPAPAAETEVEHETEVEPEPEVEPEVEDAPPPPERPAEPAPPPARPAVVIRAARAADESPPAPPPPEPPQPAAPAPPAGQRPRRPRPLRAR